ncbi:unnamed protein product, partial [Prorocentrum cordatum]
QTFSTSRRSRCGTRSRGPRSASPRPSSSPRRSSRRSPSSPTSSRSCRSPSTRRARRWHSWRRSTRSRCIQWQPTRRSLAPTTPSRHSVSCVTNSSKDLYTVCRRTFSSRCSRWRRASSRRCSSCQQRWRARQAAPPPQAPPQAASASSSLRGPLWPRLGQLSQPQQRQLRRQRLGQRRVHLTTSASRRLATRRRALPPWTRPKAAPRRGPPANGTGSSKLSAPSPRRTTPARRPRRPGSWPRRPSRGRRRPRLLAKARLTRHMG